MLPPDQLAALTAHINRTWVRKNCQLCDSNNWVLHGYVTLIVADTLGLVLGAPVMPSAAAVCQVCGHTVLINLLVARVVQVPIPVPASPEPSAGSTGSTGPRNG